MMGTDSGRTKGWTFLRTGSDSSESRVAHGGERAVSDATAVNQQEAPGAPLSTFPSSAKTCHKWQHKSRCQFEQTVEYMFLSLMRWYDYGS